ncbi:hypothetical protein [Paenibacillus amylolyticus]|uniref:hypothetical protein n=1 Tax=Paenibacillus amylolyticus TaxID=1451 RepID=UPI00096BD5D0|nr:hypothetical protein [Paenibacillus amylolyticus]OMF47730.1 hypothetical protein BK136_02225 [Paenibacillus amylolyticus]
MSSNKNFIDYVLQGPIEIKKAEICRHFKLKDGTCYECRLESERDQLREEIKIKNDTIEILTKQVTDEVAISAVAIVERDQLKKTLKDALKLMDNKFYGMAHKNIVEALGQGRESIPKEDTKDGI